MGSLVFLEATVPSAITNLIAVISALVSEAWTWITGAVTTITASGNEILLLCMIALPLVGIGIGLFKRLVHIKA